MEKFYTINSSGKTDEVFIESYFVYDEYGTHKAKVGVTAPTEFFKSEGKSLYDLVRFQDVSNFAISERLYSTLIENNITGWTAYKINIAGVKQRYFAFQVTGRCGKIIYPKESGFFLGYNFDLGSWDKSDIFSPEGNSSTFCTKRVRDIILKGNFTNIELRDIKNIEVYSLGEE
ncbi:MAG: hypothetical protein K1X91_08550 [Bacteriodetes bacterium]|nr:hypothetical protein [Bacteroidota bacterium]